MVVITGNISLESLLEGLFAQVHIDLSWRSFGRNRTRDLRITQICQVPRSSPLSYGDGCITKDPSGPSISVHVCLIALGSYHAANSPEKLEKFIRVVHNNSVACKRGLARIRQHFRSGHWKPCDWRKLVLEIMEVWLWSEGGVVGCCLVYLFDCLFVCMLEIVIAHNNQVRRKFVRTTRTIKGAEVRVLWSGVIPSENFQMTSSMFISYVLWHAFVYESTAPRGGWDNRIQTDLLVQVINPPSKMIDRDRRVSDPSSSPLWTFPRQAVCSNFRLPASRPRLITQM